MPRRPYVRDMSAFESLVIMNDFFDYSAPLLTGSELKLALVILRRTIGWYKLSDQIGVTQFCTVSGMDKDTVKRNIHGMCAKVGIRVEQERVNGVLLRRHFTWPITERVETLLREVQENHERERPTLYRRLPPQ